MKPILSALILPPVPWLLLALVGARCATSRRRGLGFSLVLLACTGLWMSCCMGSAQWLQDHVVQPPPALDAPARERLAAMGRQRGTPTAAIWVLGGGRHKAAPEFDGASNLTAQAMVRLRYGVWLARQTGLPLGFTGGLGWAQADAGSQGHEGPPPSVLDPLGGPDAKRPVQARAPGHAENSEAGTAARIAQQEGGVAMRWQESGSRDTRENARLSMPMLRAAGIRELVLVTHAAHMPRALRAFREAAAVSPGEALNMIPAPVGFVLADDELPVLRWLPSPAGYQNVYNLVHEWVGQVTGH